jgi:hypothetical protein
MRTDADDVWRQQRRRRGGRAVFFAGETEARPGVMTSEFLLTLVAATTVVIAGYVSGALPVRWAWTLFGAIVVAYILSRGIAKAGSKTLCRRWASHGAVGHTT